VARSAFAVGEWCSPWRTPSTPSSRPRVARASCGETPEAAARTQRFAMRSRRPICMSWAWWTRSREPGEGAHTDAEGTARALRDAIVVPRLLAVRDFEVLLASAIRAYRRMGEVAPSRRRVGHIVDRASERCHGNGFGSCWGPRGAVGPVPFAARPRRQMRWCRPGAERLPLRGWCGRVRDVIRSSDTGARERHRRPSSPPRRTRRRPSSTPVRSRRSPRRGRVLPSIVARLV